MVDTWGFALIGISSFVVTFATFPSFIKRMHIQKIEWGDFNKKGKPLVAGMGGVVVLLGFVFSIMVGLFLHSYFHLFFALDLLALLAALLTIILVGLIGIIDDIIGWTKGMRQYQHALFPIFAALPIMVLPQTIGNTGMVLPYFGLVNFGILYSLIVVPIAVTGASNATNMLAGLNGLEAGLASINALALLVVGLITGRVEVVLIMLGLLGSLIAFLKFNWSPARVFPGDSFTLMIGASFAAVSIVGNIERVGLMLFGLYFVELVLKGRTKMQAQSFGIIQEDGTLQAPPRIGSLTHVVMRMGRFTESQAVKIILSMQVIVALLALLVFWLNFTLHNPLAGSGVL